MLSCFLHKEGFWNVWPLGREHETVGPDRLLPVLNTRRDRFPLLSPFQDQLK